MTDSNNKKKVSFLTKVKNYLFPIEHHEWKKILPMMLMMILCCFNYSLAKDMKILCQADKTAQEVGLFQKFFWVMPLSVVFMIVYTKLDVKYSKHTVFYIVLGLFTSLYSLYLIFSLVNAQVSPKSGWAKKSGNNVDFAIWFLTTVETWVETYLGIVSELWGAVMLGLMFWGFANSICTRDEAVRFYPVINISATFATMFSGILTLSVGSSKPDKETSKYIPALFTAVIVFFCFGIGYTYRYMVNNVLNDPKLCPPEKLSGGGKKKKVKMGFVDSLKFVFTSAYIAMIAGIVACYGLVVNFLEVPYHQNIMSAHAGKEKSVYKGVETLVQGFFILFLLVTVGSRSVRLFGWTKTALVSPVAIAIFGTLAMVYQLINLESMKEIYQMIKNKNTNFSDDHKSIISTVYWFSFVSTMLARSFKYSFFDPTKELVYLPLDQDVRGKAKAAVDVVGARFGKAFPALIQLILLSSPGFETGMDYFVITFVLYVVFMVLWFICTIYLGRAYNKFEAERIASEATVEIQMSEKKTDEKV